jgi:hypothetical protein
VEAVIDNRNYFAFVRSLQAASLEIRQKAEQAELLVDEAHAAIRRLATAHVIGPRLLLGSIVLSQPYSLEAEMSSSGQMVQAALSSQNGFGVILWDSEELAELNRSARLEYEAAQRFVPIGECPPAIKAAMLSELEPLLGQFLRALA